MSFTDQSSYWIYKRLLTHQAFDAAAENSLLHENKQTGVTDFDAIIKFDNTKGIAGELAAGGSYKNLVTFDASNVVQLGEAGTEVRVPADPVNALGVCTKAYAEALQMFQLQEAVNAGANTNSLVTVLELSATTRGILHAVYGTRVTNAGTIRVKITIDGTVVVDETSATIAAASHRFLGPNGKWSDADLTTANGEGGINLIHMPFNSSCKVEVSSPTSNATATVYVRHSIIP